jgi:hypothetical protein
MPEEGNFLGHFFWPSGNTILATEKAVIFLDAILVDIIYRGPS